MLFMSINCYSRKTRNTITFLDFFNKKFMFTLNSAVNYGPSGQFVLRFCRSIEDQRGRVGHQLPGSTFAHARLRAGARNMAAACWPATGLMLLQICLTGSGLQGS